MYDDQLKNLEIKKKEKIKSKENTHMELQKARDLIEENFKKRKEEIVKRENKTINDLQELI